MAFYFFLATAYSSTAYYVYAMSEMSPILQSDSRFTKRWQLALSLSWPVLVLASALLAIAKSISITSEAN